MIFDKEVKLSGALVLVAIVLASVGCTHRSVIAARPYDSATGFAFQVHDGTGTYDSADKTYHPSFCGREFPSRRLDIGQSAFERVEQLVAVGDLWSAKAVDIPGCHPIDPAPEEPGFFQFQAEGKFVQVRVGQCQRLPEAQKTYFEEIRAIVRKSSDRIVINSECVRL